jgi:hypothetical protein
LKAIIAQNDLTVPPTHDLITLYAQVSEVASSVTLDEETLRQIGEAYIETRYPTDTATEAGPSIGTDRAEPRGRESKYLRTGSKAHQRELSRAYPHHNIGFEERWLRHAAQAGRYAAANL